MTDFDVAFLRRAAKKMTVQENYQRMLAIADRLENLVKLAADIRERTEKS